VSVVAEAGTKEKKKPNNPLRRLVIALFTESAILIR
jgi:hypothetical protein